VEALGFRQIAQLVVRQIDAVHLQGRVRRIALVSALPMKPFAPRIIIFSAMPVLAQQRPKVKRVMLAFSGTFGRRLPARGT